MKKFLVPLFEDLISKNSSKSKDSTATKSLKNRVVTISQEIKDRLTAFVTGRDPNPNPEKPIDPKIIATIETAMAKKTGVHVIYQQRDFTGSILKFDQNRSQLVIENFKGSITMIIHLKEIHKISILPVSLTD